MADKGGRIAGDYSSRKRKRDRNDKYAYRKRKNLSDDDDIDSCDNVGISIDMDPSDSGVFINDGMSSGIYFSDDDVFINDGFIVDDIGPDLEVNSEPNSPYIPFFLEEEEEEEIDEEELDISWKENDEPVSPFAKCSKSKTKAASLDERDTYMSSMKDPTIWKVKCRVGRESRSVFSLMQRHVDLQSLGIKLQMLSAFNVEHEKGFIYIEAEKQSDITEACKCLPYINPSRVAPVEVSEVPDLFIVQIKENGVKVGTWARVRRGHYKGDLAHVVSVDEVKVTVKLVPRLDLQAVAEKIVVAKNLQFQPLD